MIRKLHRYIYSIGDTTFEVNPNKTLLIYPQLNEKYDFFCFPTDIW